MKIQLETIPVWDGVKEGSECFICTLMKKPEVRVETNTHVFCSHHFSMLAEGGKPQSLALVMDTFYEESKRILSPYADKVHSASSARKAEKAINAYFNAYHEKRDKGCLICSRMEDRLMRYCYTVASLWKEDAEFRKALMESKGFCVHHTEALLRIAKEALSGDDLLAYYQDIFSLMEKNIDRVQHDDWWMTQKYKSENKDKPWNGCEDAQKRAVYKLVGEGQVIDPV